jgi:periplasmic protein TonB
MAPEIMTPLKDTLEALSSAAESAVSHAVAQPAKPAGHLRSDAVSLEIPVKIHGSRVIEMARGVAPRTEPFEEQTSTMIVFPQGGVVRMATPASAGQMLILTNLKSRQDAICRIVKVRSQASTSSGYVEVEFTQPQPGYWGVYFPTDGPEVSRKTASPAAPAASQSPAPENAVPDASRAPAPTPVSVKAPEAPAPPTAAPPRFVPTVKPPSSFISIGSQEKVQLAATEVPRNGATMPSQRSAGSNFPSTAPAAPSRPLSLEELLADVQPGIVPGPSGSSAGESEHTRATDTVVEMPAPHARATSARSASSAALGSELSSTEESFGAQLEPGARARGTQERAAGQNWILIAACAALVLTSATGGFFYLHHRHAASAAAAISPVVAQPALPVAAAPIAENIVPQNSGAQHKAASALPGASPAAHVNSPSAVSSNSAAPSGAVAPSQPTPPAKHAASSSAPNLFGVLNAHPVSSAHAANQEAAAPSVAAPALSADGGSSIGGASSPSGSLPPLSAANSHSAPIGPGSPQVTQPRLISSVQPSYPAVAMQMRTQGDVVIRAQIDANGKVAGMKVVSGSALLQQAAVDALRQWKYQPSRLDGQPVPAEILVTIRFRL